MAQARRESRVEQPRLFLRITHPHIDPATITRSLEVEPEYATQAGDSVNAQGVKKVHSQSYWLASLSLLSLEELLEARSNLQSIDMPAQATVTERYRALRQLTKGLDLFGLQLLRWLKHLERQRAFIKRIIDEDGSITLVVQRDDRETPFIVGPGLAHKLAELEIGLEID